VTERKTGNMHLLISLQGRPKFGVKMGGKWARKVTERKMGNKHLLEADKAHIYKGERREK
jgi:hypothetical protein